MPTANNHAKIWTEEVALDAEQAETGPGMPGAHLLAGLTKCEFHEGPTQRHHFREENINNVGEPLKKEKYEQTKKKDGHHPQAPQAVTVTREKG
jgi:hypothetical protein